MCTIVTKIEEVGKDDLEKVFAEGDAHGVGAQIREVWVTDKKQLMDQFKADQSTNSKLHVIDIMFLVSNSKEKQPMEYDHHSNW